MKVLRFLIPGILFGIIMTKSEAVSWFRIQEMFRFESFHMYGIISVAVMSGALLIFLIKRSQFKDITGELITFNDKNQSVIRYLIGGAIFGLGWSMTGACPGPLFTLVGHGIGSILIVIFSALVGTYVYGIIRHKIPH